MHAQGLCLSNIYGFELFFKVVQVGQQAGEQGKADKKQLQLTPKQSPNTWHTQLWTF